MSEVRDATGPEAGIGKSAPWWRNALGWAVAAGILALLFWRIPIGETMGALKHANLAKFVIEDQRSATEKIIGVRHLISRGGDAGILWITPTD